MKKGFYKLVLILLPILLVCSMFALTGCGDKTIKVTGITFDETEIVLLQGDSVDLLAAITPDNSTNKKIVWKTDADDVATVSQLGKVAAVGKGVAIITATTEDGAYEAACTVTVNSEVDLLLGVTQSEYELRDYFKLPFADLEFYSNGKLIIKNPNIVNDNRGTYLAVMKQIGLLPADTTALPEAMWGSDLFFAAFGILATECIPVLYDIETEFYWQDGNLVIKDAVAIVEEALKDEYGNQLKDENDVPLKKEVEKIIPFNVTPGTGDASGTTKIGASFGNFSLDVVDTAITKAVEKPSELGNLLFTVAAGEADSGIAEFYDSGIVVFSGNLSVSLLGRKFPTAGFKTTFTFSDGVLAITTINSVVDLTSIGFGTGDFPMLFTVSDGADGAVIIDLNTDNGSVLDIATFTITAEQLALLA